MPRIESWCRQGDRPDRPTSHRLTWELPPGPDGKRQRERELFHGSKSEANQRWFERQAELQATRHSQATVEDRRMLLRDWLDSWMADYGRQHLEDSTFKSYNDLIRVHIGPHLGHQRLDRLTPQMIADWQGELAGKQTPNGKPLSPRRIAYARQVLRAALREAQRRGLLTTENPVDRVRPPKQSPQRVQSFTRDEAQRLDEILIMLDDRLSVIPTLAWQTGLRLGEILALKWSDLNLVDRTLSVQRTLVEIPRQPPRLKPLPKTSAGFRTVLLTSDLVPLLRRHQSRQEAEREKAGAKWQDAGLVFARTDGRPLSSSTVQGFYKRMRDLAGLPPYRFHALRHTFASLALQAGVGIAEISALLGHTSVAFTAQTYAHVLDATRRQAAERFDRFVQQSERGAPQ